MSVECKDCGDEEESPNYIPGARSGYYCLSCAGDMPVCDDCDHIVQDGDYHRCRACGGRE